MNDTNQRECGGCMWEDICSYSRPCHYFTPCDTIQEIEDRVSRRRRIRFYEEWNEYIEYNDDENSFF